MVSGALQGLPSLNLDSLEHQLGMTGITDVEKEKKTLVHISTVAMVCKFG